MRAEEQWRPIFNGRYEVSNLSRVRTSNYLRFQGEELIKVSGKILKPFEVKGTMRVTVNSMPYSFRDFKVDYLASLVFSEYELELTN